MFEYFWNNPSDYVIMGILFAIAMAIGKELEEQAHPHSSKCTIGEKIFVPIVSAIFWPIGMMTMLVLATIRS